MGKRKDREIVKNNDLKGIFFIMAATIIWSIALIAQKAGTASMGPFSFTGIRCTLGAISMFPLILFLDSRKTAEQKAAEHNPKALLKGSLISGILVMTYIILQQFGIVHTTAGKAGFITALYIVIVPVAGIFMKRKVEGRVWLAVFIALAGFYLMSMTDGLEGINRGDILMLCAAVFVAAHIYSVDFFVNKVDPVKFSCFQFLTAGLVSLIFSFFLETITLEAVKSALIPILYTGICSCGLGYTCQIIGQKYMEPSRSSLLMSTETIFTMIAGMIFFQEMLTVKEYLGCVIIFAAILISQIKRKS